MFTGGLKYHIIHSYAHCITLLEFSGKVKVKTHVQSAVKSEAKIQRQITIKLLYSSVLKSQFPYYIAT